MSPLRRRPAACAFSASAMRFLFWATVASLLEIMVITATPLATLVQNL